ncbi:ribosome maturation factor RimP [Convivina intestini]|uniref:ribosome maturation factor RimP n=1 Tax=Convivina intestini TaxID=1505726 RepID=UPI00200D2F1E|nr:ribosome maturation factor RimP [Convivina intestini]CAH1852221.1 Ribosome maturation factor RimP [Convivina intestini]
MAGQAKNALLTLIQPILDDQGLLLWQLSIKNGGGQKTVEVLVDRPEHVAVTMDDLTLFTQAVNEVLDDVDNDPIPEAYLLDISSPGLDRPLAEQWHFQWALEGQEPIALALFSPRSGQKKWTGKLTEVTDQGITIESDQGLQQFNYDEIAKAALDVQF